jgi:cellulose synthase/poly-beta-1,6-N-acetylglucosamine synthase-like glycosyltransferase
VVTGVRFLGGAALVIAVLAGSAYLVPQVCCGMVYNGLTWAGWLCGVALFVLVAAEAFELVELFCLPTEPTMPAVSSTAPRAPVLSVHVPICAEPPELVERTLRALHALPYDGLEVIVVDNNTEDATLWLPVEQLCRELGPMFRFFHLSRWPGYKAGALNFALAQTSEDTSVIAVIDSDYEVEAGFIDGLIGHFANADIAFAQAPQNYRQWEDRYFTRMCYWEYWQFFAVSMRLRQHRNAILMHGTMVMIRKSALLQVGGWSEWCLTEDSELGLRLLAAGYRGVYCDRTLGRGLVPFSSRDYKRQRERWVTGGMQTLVRHWRLFLPWRDSLTLAQKLHYLQGWAPWLRDGIVVASTPLAIVLTGYSLWIGTAVPVLPLATAVLTVTIYLVLRESVVYRLFLKQPWSDVFGAGLAIFGLVTTAGAAVVRSGLGRQLEFERTPKQQQAVSFMAKRTVWEALVSATMIVLTAGFVYRFGVSAAIMPAAGMMAYSGFFACSVATDVLARQRPILR